MDSSSRNMQCIAPKRVDAHMLQLWTCLWRHILQYEYWGLYIADQPLWRFLLLQDWAAEPLISPYLKTTGIKQNTCAALCTTSAGKKIGPDAGGWLQIMFLICSSSSMNYLIGLFIIQNLCTQILNPRAWLTNLIAWISESIFFFSQVTPDGLRKYGLNQLANKTPSLVQEGRGGISGPQSGLLTCVTWWLLVCAEGIATSAG